MINIIHKTLAAALLVSAGAAHAATVNGFANGGFEVAGNGDLAANWIEGNQGYSRVCGGAGNGSDCAALLMSPEIAAAVVVQNSIDDGMLPPLTEGDNPIFSFSAKGFAGTTGNANFALRYLDDIGNILADTGPTFFDAQLSEDSWTEFMADLGPVPVGATAAFVEIVQAIGPIGTGPAGEEWLAGEIYIDDVYLGVAPVPIPAAAWFFGSGLIGLIGLARKRKAARA